jgi:serine/threonine protein kinase
MADKVGPYVLVEPIGRGGMAEVYRARRDGPGGFVKDVALKKILPQYARNKQLVQRFMEEARVAGALTHGNIAQVYDFGQDFDFYYIVMEYIDGMSLAVLLDRCAALEVPLPSPLVAYIGSEACSGLAYAHKLTDASGRWVEVVHRDVSPQNVLLSYAGDVKISDFGIAKAADSMIRTEAGLRLGKASYMSPEQARGEPLDGRSDLFALGVTLWEALTLKPLLPRGDAVKTIEVLAACNFPKPSSLRPDVPRELEEIVMQSLSHDRDRRFTDGEDFARALRAFVHLSTPGFGRRDLVEYLQWIDIDASRPSGRQSGLGPPMPPPPPLASVRPAQQPAPPKAPIWPWIVLAASPFVGLVAGTLAFLSLSLLLPSERTPTATPHPVATPVQPVSPVGPGVAVPPPQPAMGGALPQYPPMPGPTPAPFPVPPVQVLETQDAAPPDFEDPADEPPRSHRRRPPGRGDRASHDPDPDDVPERKPPL